MDFFLFSLFLLLLQLCIKSFENILSCLYLYDIFILLIYTCISFRIKKIFDVSINIMQVCCCQDLSLQSILVKDTLGFLIILFTHT